MLYYLFDITVTVEANEIKETFSDVFPQSSPMVQSRQLLKLTHKILWIKPPTITVRYFVICTPAPKPMYKQVLKHINSQKKNIITFMKHLKKGNNPFLFLQNFQTLKV